MERRQRSFFGWRAALLASGMMGSAAFGQTSQATPADGSFDARAAMIRMVKWIGLAAPPPEEQSHLVSEVEIFAPSPAHFRYERWTHGSRERSRYDHAGDMSEEMVDRKARRGWQVISGFSSDLPTYALPKKPRSLSPLRLLHWMWLPGTTFTDQGSVELPTGEWARKVSVKVPGFVPMHYFLDPPTGALQAFNYSEGEDDEDGSLLQVVRDIREIPGVGKYPSLLETYSGDALMQRIQFTEMDFRTPIDDAVFVRPENPLRYAPESKLPARVPLRFVNGLLFVPVTINKDTKALFLLDTGSYTTALSKGLAEKLHLKLGEPFHSYSGLGNFLTRGTQVETLEVAGAIRRDLAVNVIMDETLSRTLQVTGLQVDGILGNSYLNGFLPTIDYSTQSLVLQKPDMPTPAGISIPMTLDGGSPTVLVQIAGGKPLPMTFDTGANRTWIAPKYAATLPRTQVSTFQVNQYEPNRYSGLVVHLPTIAAGKAKLHNVNAQSWPLNEGGGTTGSLLMDEEAGIYGSDLLRHFRYSIDYRRQQIVLEPLRTPAAGQKDTMGIGAWFARKDSLSHRRPAKVLANHVMPFSPAAQAGVKEGDQLVKIEGRVAAKLSEESLQRLLWSGREGEPLRLVLRRRGRVLALVVRRERFL